MLKKSCEHAFRAGREPAPLTALLISSLLAASAQQQDAITKFQSNSQLVVEVVTVHDRNGQTIEGLTAKDFTVTENGVPQTIRFSEFQKLEEVPAAAPAPAPTAQTTAPKVASVTGNQIAPEPPGDIHYKNRRLLSLYFDMTAMPI